MYADKLGVYKVGDLKFHSKYEAIQMHQKTGIHPQWDFNEAVFSSYDWTTEPMESLPEIYKQRAQQLREKYDYLILNYSGGADSNNILDTFALNDIKLDEICHFSNYSKTGNKNDYMNGELFKVAFPKVAEVKEKYPWIKHRIVDLPELTLEYFKTTDTDKWLYELNSVFSPNGIARESLPLKIKEWADIIHSGKKLAVITGVDKPRLVHHPDGRFSFRFLDFVDGSTTVSSMAGLQPYADELFYWTPDMPQIAIKQAHIVKRFLTDKNSINSPYMSDKRSNLAFININGKPLWLNNHGLHKLIYPTWDISTFSVGKPRSLIFSPRDDWIFKLEDSHYLRVRWEYGLSTWWKNLPDYWKNDVNDVSKGIKLCCSKDYFLSKE